MNSYYQAMMEGRYPIIIETTLASGGDTWIATFADNHGQNFTAEDSSQAEAHRRCTAAVMEAIREGTIVPEL